MFSILIYILMTMALVWWVDGSRIGAGNSLILKRDPSEELEDWLKRFSWGNRSQVNERPHLPQYKFYSEIVETLLSLARKMGGNYQESLLFLRDGLQSDRQFEKKMKELKWGCLLQMALMVVLTWIFIVVALSMVEIQVSYLKLILIGGWQGVGLLLLPLLIKHLKQKLFGDIGRLWKMLYVLSSLARVPLARTEIFNMAQIHELKSIKQKSLMPLVDKLKNSCERALKVGRSYEEDVNFLMEELRFQEKWHFDLFEKRLTVIKLGLLTCFFLPAYLSFIFLLLGDLMTLM